MPADKTDRRWLILLSHAPIGDGSTVTKLTVDNPDLGAAACEAVEHLRDVLMMKDVAVEQATRVWS